MRRCVSRGRRLPALGADPEQMYRANVEGTRAILEAARKNRRSAGGVHLERGHHGIQLRTDTCGRKFAGLLDDMIGPYKRSKFMAEQVAMEAGARDRMWWLSIPATPVGERDIKPTPTGRIVVDFLKKKFPAYVDTGLNLVDVERVRAGPRCGAGKGKKRRALHSGGRESDAEADSRQTGGDHRPAVADRCSVPYVLALATGVVDEIVHRQDSRPRAARHDRCCPHGPEEDFVVFGQSRTRVGMEGQFLSTMHCGGRRSGFGRNGYA